MKYKIKIEEIKEEGKSYGETIYEQIFTTDDDTILENVIKSVNGITVTY